MNQVVDKRPQASSYDVFTLACLTFLIYFTLQKKKSIQFTEVQRKLVQEWFLISKDHCESSYGNII